MGQTKFFFLSCLAQQSVMGHLAAYFSELCLVNCLLQQGKSSIDISHYFLSNRVMRFGTLFFLNLVCIVLPVPVTLAARALTCADNFCW